MSVFRYFPSGHASHDVDPLAALTTDPPGQVLHAVCELLSWSYWPAPHAVHDVAPVPVPVSVAEPASHVVQVETVPPSDHLPAMHGVFDVNQAAPP